MVNSNSNNLPVLIVGAGPIGLTMALALTMRGIRIRLVDKAAKADGKSKALGIHARTLELLEMLGVVDRFLEVGHKVHATKICNGKQKLVDLCFDEMGGQYPFALMVPQNETERILTEELQKRAVKIEREIELVNFMQDDTTVTATLKHADGIEKIVKINWLLGCDGAHSTVRKLLGLKFEGAAYEEAFATVDCHMEWQHPEDELYGFVSGEEGSVFFFPMGNKRYRIVADGPHHNTTDVLTMDEMQQMLAKRIPDEQIKLYDPNWLAWFNISRRSCAEYRNGRIFIAGDAAHIHSPFMGQGMNTGMQDALNLAWKLELVEKGWAKSELLDSYQEERHPIGQMLIRNTDAVTKIVTLRNPVAAHLRNKLMPILAGHEVVQHRAWRTLSMLGINYRNSPIVGEYRASIGKSLSNSISNLSAWLDFSHGPTPGDRAHDGEIALLPSNKQSRLFEQLQGMSHNLILFAGLSHLQESLDMIANLSASVKLAYDDFIHCHVVVTKTEEAVGLNGVQSIMLDKGATLHHQYGAAQGCLYLIRPDGYVGFRCQPINFEQLQEFLSRIMQIRTAAIK